MSVKRIYVKGKNVKGEEVKLSKDQPFQLSLFSKLTSADVHSNTIELYDAIPKYYPARHLNRKRVPETEGEPGKFLPILKRYFRHKSKVTNKVEECEVLIKPALLENKELGERHYYPTEREELIEEALRKIATDGSNGVYLDDKAGVQFTLYQLRKELKERGHAMQLQDIIDGLHVCNESMLEVRTSSNGSATIKSSIFPVLLIAKREDWEKDPKNVRCYVQFHPLVTNSINALTYRQYDYKQYMNYKRGLSRWLHKRLFHNFVQADLVQRKYNIMASTIITHSGMLNASRLRDNIVAIEHALKELESADLLENWEKEVRETGSRSRIADVKYTLTVTYDFIKKMRRANSQRKGILAIANEAGYKA